MFDALGSFIRLPRSVGQSPNKSGTFATSKELPNLTPYVTIIDYVKGGGQADIKKARLQYKNETKIVAVKQLRYSDDAAKLAHLEMRMWSRVNGHENVVQLLGKLLDSRGFPSMVAEYCERGDLLSYTFSVARFNHKDLLSDILKGLQHIHELNLAHGDLKPENVVLTTQSKRLAAKICDFGSTRGVSSADRTSLEYTCTALYRSPELSTEEESFTPTFAADIWAFGCVAFVVLCKKMPYHWVKNRWTIDILIASRKPPYSENDKWPDTSLRHLVQSCWCDTAIRPSADSLLRRLTSRKPRSHTPSRSSQPPAYSHSPRLVAQPVHKPRSTVSDSYRGHRSWDPPVANRLRRQRDRPDSPSSGSSRPVPIAAPVPPLGPRLERPAPDRPQIIPVSPPSSISPAPQIIRIGSPSQRSTPVSPPSSIRPPQVIQIGSPSPWPTRRSPVELSIPQPVQVPHPGQVHPVQPSPGQPYPITQPIRIGSPNSSTSRIPAPIIIQFPLPSRSRRSHSRSPTHIVEVGDRRQSSRPTTPVRSHHPTSRPRRSRSRSPRVIHVGGGRSTRSSSPIRIIESRPRTSSPVPLQDVDERAYSALTEELCYASASSRAHAISLSPASSASDTTLAEESPVEHSYRSRPRSGSRSPTRIIRVEAPAGSRRLRPPHPPSRIVYIGNSPGRFHRSRSRSPASVPERERVVSRREPRYSPPRTPTGRRHEHRSPSRPRRHSRSRSRSRSPPVVVRPGLSDRRDNDRTINININLTISPDGRVRVSPQSVTNTIRVTAPPRPAQEQGRSSAPRTHRATEARPRNRSGREPRSEPRRAETVESPVGVEAPYRRWPNRDQTVIPPTIIRAASQATTDSPYSSTILRSSSLPPEHPFISPTTPAGLDAELEQVGFAHQEPYTFIRCATVDGRKVVEKSLQRSAARRNDNQDAIYLNYHEDMLRLKHDHLVEIHGIFHQSSANGPTLTMEYYPTDLLTYRENLDYGNQLRVFCEILEGLNALHSSEPPIAHQCLKASNVMIDANGSVKLSLMNSEPYIAFCRQPAPTPAYSSNWPKISRWWSPDVFNDRAMLSRVENDIWAFGCVMLEVFTDTVPYSTFQEDASLVRHIQAGNTPDSGLRRSSRLKLWKDVVRRCWATPRPTTAYMLNLLCDHLSREVMKGVADLTGQVARAMNPFVRGHSADIYSGIYTDRASRSLQQSVVIKLVRLNHTAQKTKFLLWLGDCVRNKDHFVHPNICQLLGVMYSAKLGPLLIYEHYPGGNLFDYLRVKGESLRFQDKLQIMSGILDALVHLHHDQDIAWGDLHPGNIVLDESGNPKLCGLGPRPSLHHEAASKGDLSVIRYFGPERYLAEATIPDKATDVWAFGCLIIKILTGYDPYREARTTYGVVRAVTSAQKPYDRSDCDVLPLWFMASSCWTEGLLQRPVVTSLAVRIGKITTET